MKRPSRRSLRAAASRAKYGDAEQDRQDNRREVLLAHGWNVDQVAELRQAERKFKRGTATTAVDS